MLRTTTDIIVVFALLSAAHPVAAGWDEGVAAFKSRDYAAALDEFLAAVDAHPDSAAVQYMLGQTLQKLDRKEESLAHLRQAYELDPSQFAIRLSYAQALLSDKRFREAADVIGGVDRSSLPEVQLAGFDAMVAATANVLFRQARESDPAHRKNAYIANAEAIAKLTSISPTYANLLLLGQAQLGASQYANAVVTLEKARAQKNDEWTLYLYLGMARTSLSQLEEAQDALNTALRYAPASGDSSIWRQIGLVQERRGDRQAAIDAYRRGGDAQAVARVEQNQKIAEENRQIEAENEAIERMRREAEELERQLRELEGEPPSRR